MKIELKNLDAELTFNVGAEDIRTGQSIGTVAVAPGQTAVIEITDGHHLSGSPSGPSAPANGSNIPDAPALKEDEVEQQDPVEPTDQDVADALTACRAAGAETTKSGAIELAALNTELASKGFTPVAAKRRDDVAATLAA